MFLAGDAMKFLVIGLLGSDSGDESFPSLTPVTG
jgi:hypothetical protein